LRRWGESLMRLRETLLGAAAVIVASGCDGALASPTRDDADAGAGADAGATTTTSCCPPNMRIAGVTAPIASSVACTIAAGARAPGWNGDFAGAVCDNACASVCGAPPCQLPQSYVEAFNALNGDGGGRPRPVAGDGSPDAWPVDANDEESVDAGTPLDGASADVDAESSTVVCPKTSATIAVSCGVLCGGGRRTEGFAARGDRGGTDGERLARMAWLEAVSVHAFDRLERELAAHGAPPSLRRDARRARRDEVRHTAMTTRLARRRGAKPVVPERPSTMHVRALVDVAIENAIEGCVRETHGALLAFVEALSSPDPSLRRAMRSIAEDECRHAELAWSVHAWALPRLPPAARKRVDDALRAAARELPAWARRTIEAIGVDTSPASTGRTGPAGGPSDIRPALRSRGAEAESMTPRRVEPARVVISLRRDCSSWVMEPEPMPGLSSGGSRALALPLPPRTRRAQ
jgi:hypothetical protein